MTRPDTHPPVGAVADPDAHILLQVEQLILDLPHLQTASHSFSLRAGERLAVLGKNGAGKTTLLHTLAGLRKAYSGQILMHNKPLAAWRKNDLARFCSLLFQSHEDQMPATVRETVMLGRLPYSRNWQWESGEDAAIVSECLQDMELDALQHRPLATLSGGERQRVAIAALMAQQPSLYLLDEPSNHLDIAFQQRALMALCEETRRGQRALIMATHDINLAASYCSHVLLFMPDGQSMFGDSAHILTTTLLSEAYSCEIGQVELPGGERFFFPAPAGFSHI